MDTNTTPTTAVTVNEILVRGGGTLFTYHDLRALAATRCATPEIAMRLLGHSSINLTLRIYRRGVERVKRFHYNKDNTVKTWEKWVYALVGFALGVMVGVEAFIAWQFYEAAK